MVFLFFSLVDDVLGHNAGDKVPMEKVVMLLWAFRDDPSVVKFMAQFVSKVRWFRLRALAAPPTSGRCLPLEHRPVLTTLSPFPCQS
jgi:hypothetical protein